MSSRTKGKSSVNNTKNVSSKSDLVTRNANSNSAKDKVESKKRASPGIQLADRNESVKKTKSSVADAKKVEDTKETKISQTVPAVKKQKTSASKEDAPIVNKKQKSSNVKEESQVVDTSKRPSPSHIKLACDALLQHVAAYQEKKKQKALSLPGVSKESDAIFLQIGLRGMPEKALKTFKGKPIPLPFPFRDIAETSVCMFVKDKPEAKKWLGDDYEKHGIKKIISLQQLRTQYKAYQDLRELANLYDAFVADDRIVCMLPKALGKAFYVGSKRPLPIRLAQRKELNGDVTAKIQKALKSAFFYQSGVSTSMRVGTTEQTAEQLMANVEAGLNGAIELIPGKWGGVQSIFIKSERSAALPLYESAGDAAIEQ